MEALPRIDHSQNPTSGIIIGQLNDFFEKPIVDAGRVLKVRYISLNDSTRQSRRDWLNGVFSHIDEFAYGEGGTYFLSVAESEYDVIVFGGKDPQRLKRIFRQNELMLRQKIKLCVLHGCTPHDRAELLMAGFDDAIDVTRTDEQEAAARVLSILRRYTLAAEMDRIARGDELKLAQISDVGQLTKRQKATLLTMIASGDAPATYARLCNILSLDHEPMKLSSLKVFICTLRKRLRPGARIRSVSGVGYTLHLPA